jgi:uncharacterized protein
MSEFTQQYKEKRVQKLMELYFAIMRRENAFASIKENQQVIESVIPSDIITLVDRLVNLDQPLEDLKTGINKLLNVVYKPIKNFPYSPPAESSFLGACIKNNQELEIRLTKLKPLLRDINKTPNDSRILAQVKESLLDIQKFNNYYLIKENVLFPLLEKRWEEFRCLSIMWSFHDDIRRNLGLLIEYLSQHSNNDLSYFNQLIGKVYFNMYAIMFRDERILFPFIEETLQTAKLDTLISESLEIGFPYYNPVNIGSIEPVPTRVLDAELINLKSGELSVEQIILLFNHLPLDLTYVDEFDTVRYFSNPPKRIFPRTNSIIGRNIRNCHPPESVHVVEQIVDSFRNGTQSKASFWIKMKGEFILIQYFAIRNQNGTYKGVLEVSQEVSEIRQLEGEKRILDWEK